MVGALSLEAPVAICLTVGGALDFRTREPKPIRAETAQKK